MGSHPVKKTLKAHPNQTSEEKEITVRSNKKSEEVPASIEKRLEDLSDLNEKGLIDDDDYESKKTEILKDM